MGNERLTTREIARRLGISTTEALTLLKAAKVPSTRCGQAYLWSVQETERLFAALRPQEAAR